MLSIGRLFEAVLNMPPAQSPMAGVRDYVSSRLFAIKKAFSAGRISQAAYAQQMAELQKNKNNKGMGVTQF